MKKNNNTKQFDPFKGLVLDEYERELEKSLEETTKLSTPSKARSLEIKSMAKNTIKSIKKNKNINLRVTETTIQNLKSKAQKLGIPYQTLASSILHQFANS